MVADAADVAMNLRREILFFFTGPPPVCFLGFLGMQSD
jgi:hypothetical protein